ncbi:MAG: nitronate monooxygenase, partial [Gaiellaceae bacterium]|nr:nitronate monooxygenase [Gaiellaceae bacterium]
MPSSSTPPCSPGTRTPPDRYRRTVFAWPPIVLAPLAGGPSTPELAAAVSNAGGLGFLGAGYLTAEALVELIERTRALTAAPIGVNLFVL